MNTISIVDFQKYVDKQILPATDELENLTDKNRKHLQKLVYTNLVNRFDAMIDHSIIDNCYFGSLLDRGLKPLDSAVTEAEILKLLLKFESVRDVIRERVETSLSATLLRERNSKKLSALFAALSPDEEVWNQPRVNVSTGAILEKRKIDNKKIPHSICGYADWLYSRRNALVHGPGSAKFLERDKKYIEKVFNVAVGTRIMIKVGSITNAATFYKSICEILIRSA